MRRTPTPRLRQPGEILAGGRRVLILGASGGIGRAIASEFEIAGDIVIRPTRREIDLDREVTNNKDREIDVLVNCAGINPTKPFQEVSKEEFNRVLKVNFLSFFEIVKQITPHMIDKGKGHILNISSLYGSFSRKDRITYATSKHASNGMVKTLALELGLHNIKVNSLSPGFVMTDMTTKNNDKEKIASWEKKIPLGKLATPKDIAKVAYFLCSEQNTYITGQDIKVDGGYSIGGFEL